MRENNNSEPKNGRMHTLLRDQRVLLGISLFLAIVLWLVLAVINGDEQELTIPNVPVQADFSGTVAEELGLEPFWSGQLTDPGQLTVTVVVKCKRYEKITADTLEAELVTGNEYTAGEHFLAIRVTPKREADKDRYELVSVTPASIPLYFDHFKSREFEPAAELVGEVRVPEGYHAEDVKLSKPGVSVSGPARLVNAVATVKAEVNLDNKTYRETTVFSDILVYPVDRNGDTSPYLIVEGGRPEVNATLPVWKITALYPAVDFQNVPGAYLSAPLGVTVDPSAIHAALPGERIAENLRYSVGVVDFQKLSPANNQFSFPAEDLKEIRLFDEMQAFTAVVDLNGFDTARVNLLGTRVERMPGSRFAARFTDIDNVTVVGPAEVVAKLTPDDLTGVVEIPEGARSGRTTLPVTISVNREDCWIYGEYTVRVTLTEES